MRLVAVYQHFPEVVHAQHAIGIRQPSPDPLLPYISLPASLKLASVERRLLNSLPNTFQTFIMAAPPIPMANVEQLEHNLPATPPPNHRHDNAATRQNSQPQLQSSEQNQYHSCICTGLHRPMSRHLPARETGGFPDDCPRCRSINWPCMSLNMSCSSASNTAYQSISSLFVLGTRLYLQSISSQALRSNTPITSRPVLWLGVACRRGIKCLL